MAKDRLNEEMWQLCVPVPYRSLVLSLAHKPGHLGRDRTLQRVQDEFCWPGLFNEVKQLCKVCLDCQLADKRSPSPALLRPLPVIHTPFQQIGMDMVGPLPTTAAGNRFILVIVDCATRWPEAFPLRYTDSETVTDQLLLLFTRVGVPNQILTDCRPNFVSRLLKELYKLLSVSSITTTPYHPATDGLVERYNLIIKSMIRKTSKLWHSQWDLVLPFLLGELRRSPSATAGFTPSKLLYGRQMRGPLQMLRQKWTSNQAASTSIVENMTSIQDRLSQMKELAEENEISSKDKHKIHFDKRAKVRSFRPGELVLVRTPLLSSKVENKWQGPYSVLEKCDETAYKLNMPDHPRRRVKRHINLLREFVSPTAGCMMVSTEPDLEFGPSTEGRKEDQPGVSDRLVEQGIKELKDVLDEFLDLMHGKPGLTAEAEIRIETGCAYPISRPPYRLDAVKSKAMDDAERTFRAWKCETFKKPLGISGPIGC